MEIRGERECQDCGTQWSYYETGSVDCPNCGSLHSQGLDDRTLHTASPVALDLTDARDAAANGPIHEGLLMARDACRQYRRRTGFIHAGELQPLGDTYLAALELAHVAAEADRSLQLDDRAELYVLTLLQGADRGERPGPDDVPDALRSARGLACADAVDDYRRAIRDWLDDPDPDVRAVLGTLDDRTRWLHALDGDAAPQVSDRLVEATRDLGTALSADDEPALVRAEDRLERIG